MKKYFLPMLMLLMFPLFALAQEIPPVSDMDFISALLAAIPTFKDASTVVIILGVSQLLLKLLGTPMFANFFKNLSSASKLLIAALMHVLIGVTTLMVAGESLVAAILDSANIAMIAVFLHQVYLKFFKKD